MTKEKFVEAYTLSVMASWNEELKRRNPDAAPVGSDSNLATFARCHAAAVWELRELLSWREVY